MMTTQTTDQGNLSFPHSNVDDNAMMPLSDGKAKTVVSRLVKSWRQLIGAECNMVFFSKLLSKNISTRDIHSFIKTQAKLRKAYKGLDKPLSRHAMRSKLNVNDDHPDY